MSVITQLFQLLVKYGVHDVVCSPGSRNAALLMACSRIPELNTHVVIDERTAAFMALGMSMVSRRPVALVCTSGSALLNYAPALAEAYYQGVPLIAVSADRPEEWIDQDDSQTIRQHGAVANFVKAQYDFDNRLDSSDYIWHANLKINEGLSIALEGKKGPVHFNVHLSGTVDLEDSDDAEVRKICRVSPPSLPDSREIRKWAALAYDSKILVVAGFMPPDHKLQKAMSLMESLPNVCVMAETVSNLHLPSHCYRIDTALFSMTEEEAENLKPDLVISMGGALISRKLKEFLRKNPPTVAHISLSDSENFIDCFQSLSVKMECNPASFIMALAKKIERIRKNSVNLSSPAYSDSWRPFREMSERKISGYPWCDLKALDIVFNSLPADCNLFLSNGTSVRYAQIIPYPLTHATFSNRGVSGIEGSTSTAVGASIMYEGLTCLITGDMSFGYDLGGLVTDLESANLRIIVLDNGGGDIFRFIPATRHLPIREDYLCVRKNLPVGMLADTFGWEYHYADNEETLRDSLPEFFSDSPMPAILHIYTGDSDNSGFLRKFLTTKISIK